MQTPPMTPARHPGTTTLLSLLACALTLGAPAPALAQSAAPPAAPPAAAPPAAAPQSAPMAAAQSRQPASAPQTISGVVQDEQGARVPGAMVIVEAGTFTRETHADADGAFTLRVPPGRYTLRVETSGFNVFTQDTEVTTGQDARVTVSLTVQQVTDAVTVRASSDLVRSVSAARVDVPLIETPQSISVITQDQIQAQGAQTMQEVVRYTAGVRAEMYGLDNRGDWFSMRGGSEGSTVLDGLRLPLSGWWGNVRNEPFAFDRVEVLRGPSSAMFGQNGPGGIVNLVSKLPQDQSRQEIQLRLGNYNALQLAADFTGRVSRDRRVLYRVVTLLADGDTQVHHADEQRQYVAPSIAWRPDRRVALTVYSQYQRDRSKNNVGFFPWEGTLLPAPNGRIPDSTFIGEPDWDTYGGNRTRVGNQLEYRINDTWHLRQDFRYDRVDGNLLAMYANFFEGGLLEDGRSVNRTWNASRSHATIANAALFVDGTFAVGRTRHTLLAGIDGIWQRDVIVDVEGAAPPLDVYTPTYGLMSKPTLDFPAEAPVRTRQAGAVLQDQIKVADRWSIVAGMRRSYASTRVMEAPDAGNDDGAWTGRLGVVYLAPGDWAPYASYSNSFEAVAGVDAEHAPFKPKRGAQVEGGIKWAPARDAFMVTAAVYNLTEKNRLTTDPQNPLNQVQRGEVTVKGFELEGKTNQPAWNIVANYTYTDARVTASSDPDDPYLGKRLQSIPTHSTAVWVMHTFTPRGAFGVTGGVGLRYVGDTWDGTDRLATPSNTLTDAVFSIERGSWRYQINATNLFDRQYIATCLDRGDCWYGLRRRILGTLTFRR
jgi:iron complex outermembrane receptor protein